MIQKRDDSDAGGGAPRMKKPEASPAREPPHSLEIERGVLAVLLDGRHATAMHKARQVLQHPLGFYLRDHRIVYLAALELDDQGHRVDVQAVAELLSRYDFKAVLERLRKHQLMLEADGVDQLTRERWRELYRRQPGEDAAGYDDSALAAIGGYNAVTDLAGSYAPVAGLERNISLIQDYHLKRRLITRLTALSDKAYRTPDAFPQLVDQGAQALLDLGRGHQTTSVHAIAGVVDETMDDIGHRSQHTDEGVKTGYAKLDEALMALRPGGLYVLAARPGAGKTSLALNIVKHITSGGLGGDAANESGGAGQGVLFFSLEVDRIDLVKKLLSAASGLDFRAIETGVLEPHQNEILVQCANGLKDWRLDLMDVSDLTVNTLRSVVKRRMLEQPDRLKLVVIDYLQLLSGTRPDLNEYEKVSEISRVLKILARELRIPVLALSQMSRDSEKGAGSGPREPRLSDLRGSGTIEQDADSVIFIHRMDPPDAHGERRKMKLIVAKNRFGPTGFSFMDFYPARMKFAESSGEDYDQPQEDQAERATRRERIESQPRREEDVF